MPIQSMKRRLKWKNRTMYVLIMSRTHFRVNPHSTVSRNSLLETGTISEVQVTATGLEPITT